MTVKLDNRKEKNQSSMADHTTKHDSSCSSLALPSHWHFNYGTTSN